MTVECHGDKDCHRVDAHPIAPPDICLPLHLILRPGQGPRGGNSGRVTGTLTVGPTSNQFSIGNEALVITDILRVTLGKQGSDFINDWVKVEYGQSACPSVAFFADGSFFGWAGIFGGTQKIFEAVNQPGTIGLVDRAAPPAGPRDRTLARPGIAATRRRAKRPGGRVAVFR